MTKTLLSLMATPTAWIFLVGVVVAGLMGLCYAAKTIVGGIVKIIKGRNTDISVSDVIEDGINFATFGAISAICARCAWRLALGKNLSVPLMIILCVLIVLAVVFYALLYTQARREELMGIPEPEQMPIEESCRRKHGLIASSILAAVAVVAISTSVFAGDLRFGQPKVATDENTGKVKEIAATTKPEKQNSNGQDYDENLAPSDLDMDTKIEKWYNKYPLGEILRDPFTENDDARLTQSAYNRAVMMQRISEAATEQEKKDIFFTYTLWCIPYGAANADMLSSFNIVAQSNPKIVEFRDEHMAARESSTDRGNLHWIRKDAETGKYVPSRKYQEYAVEVCELVDKFSITSVESWLTSEQWGLPIVFENEEQIPTDLRETYHVGDPVSENSLRYEWRYTAPEDQNSLLANIWAYKAANGQTLIFGTAIDDWNQKLYPAESKRTTGTTVTTETYTPPTTTSNPPTTENPPTVTPPGDPDPEDPDEPDPVTPDPTPSQEPAKDKNDDPVNQGNAPVGGGENKPDNTTGNDKTQPKPNRNEGGGGSNVTAPSGGNNGSGQTTTKPDGSGLDNNKTSGTSSGVTSGHVQDTPQTSTSGEQVTGGTPPSAPASQPTQNTQTTVTTTVTDGNGNSTQTTSNASELEHDGFVEAE